MRAIFFLFLTFSLLATDYFSPPNILKFADYLYREGDYKRAAGEYLRYLSLARDKRLYAWKRTAKSLERSGEYSHGIKICLDAEKEFPNETFFPMERANLLIKEGKFGEVEKILEERERGAETEARLKQMVFIALILSGKWKESEKFSSFLPPNTYSAFLKNEVEKRKKFGWKSSTKAAVLSAILPGTGKIYAGRWKDGLYSMVVICLSGWQAYSGFRNGSRTKGYIFAALTAFLYAGNIYGSAVAARIYNIQMDKQIQGEIRISIPVLLK